LTPPPSPGATVLRPDAVVRLTGPSAAGLAVLGDSLWVSHFEGSTLSEVDMATGREVRTIDVGRHPGSVAALDGRLVVAHYGVPRDERRLSIVDPSTGTVSRSEPTAPLCCELVHAGDSLWTLAVNGDLVRVGPGAKVSSPARTNADANFHIGVVAAGDGVWVGSEDGSLERFEAPNGRRTATGAPGGGIPVAEDGGMLWGARPDTLWGLDARTGEPRVEHPLEDVSEILAGAANGPELWLAVRNLAGDGRVLRVDTTTGTVTGAAEVDLPTNMLMVDGTLWVTDWTNHRVLRFG